MLSLRLVAALSLWPVVAVLGVQAYMATVRASALDSRVPQGLVLCAAGAAVGWALAWIDGRLRSGPGRPRAGTASVGLSLLVVFLTATAFSHVGAHTSIKVLREEVALELAWLYPTLALLAPLILARSSRRVDAADQLLVLALGACALDGAFLFLSAPVALCLALTALAAQLAADGRRLPISGMLIAAATFVAIMGVATEVGLNQLTAVPSWRWILASAALAVAVAVRRRGADDWRRLLAAPTVAALLVAVCGVILTAYLAQTVHPDPALNTRLYLFRQHPNFLAPFFLFHGLLAVGLGCTRGGRSRLWLLGALLLFASTFMTDSNTGKAAMALGLVAIPALYVLRRVARVVPLKLVLGLGVAVPLVLAGAALTLGGDDARSFMGSRIERFEKSVDYRADAWRNSTQIVRDHPALGIGPHTFLSVERFKPGSRFFNEPQPPHPHNMALYVAQAGGLGALLAALVWGLLLLRSLWSFFAAFPRAADAPAPMLLASLLAAVLALLAANMLDLGLALMTVVPGPLFLLTGLAAASDRPRPALRPGPAALLGLVLLSILVTAGLLPVHARTLMEKAHLLAFDSSRTNDSRLMGEAHDAVRRALRLDRTTPRAHEVLSRWLESSAGGLEEARDLMLDLIALAPQDGASHGLLAQLYMRADMHREAAEEFERALSVGHGSVHQNRDRADRIWCLARIGERELAERALFDAIRLDRGVIVNMTWGANAAGDRVLRVGGGVPQPPIELVSVVQSIQAVNLADEAAGVEVSRNTWMDTYNAFRDAGRDDLALECLGHVETHVEGIREEGTLFSEQARIAEAAGDLERARQLFLDAQEISGRDYFGVLAAGVALKMGESGEASVLGEAALAGTAEILDLPTAFRDFFKNQSATFLSEGRLLEAADSLHRTLLYQEDIIERARILLRVGELCNDGGDHTRATEVILDGLDHLHAKPFPAALLQESETISLPGRLADQLGRAWAGQGLGPAERQAAAWGWSHFFSSRAGPCLFRLAFFEGNGQPAALLKEAQLQRLQRPDDLMAMWAELTALEAFGAWSDAEKAMRNLAERFGKTHDMDRLWSNFVDMARRRPDDPQVLFRAGILKLLSGQYSQSADFFSSARMALPADEAGNASRMASWQARAHFHAGGRPQARAVLEEAVRLNPGDLMLHRRLRALSGGSP